MAFCMSAVAASIPEMMMLRQIMTIKLQAAFYMLLVGNIYARWAGCSIASVLTSNDSKRREIWK